METETGEKNITVMPTVKRRISTRKKDETQEALLPQEAVAGSEEPEAEDKETEEKKGYAEPIEAAGRENGTAVQGEPIVEMDESTIMDDPLSNTEKESSSEVSADDVLAAKEIEAEMIGESSANPYGLDPEDETFVRKDAVRKEKEKILTQISLVRTSAPDAKAKGVERIKGITQASKSEKREIYSNQGLIPLGDEALFKTEGQKRHEDYITLVSSKRGHNYLTGTIYSITTQGGRICAVVRYGCFTVLIPVEKLLSTREEKAALEERDENKRFLMRRRFATQRIGSQIDFVVEAVDEVEMVAIGNRHEAMEIKKQAWYLSHDQGNEPLLNKGTRAEARVVVATRNLMFAEVFGIEYMLHERDIAYVQIPDVAAEYPVGSTVPTIFTKLERERTESGIMIRAQVSVREAMSDPRKREFDSVQVKDVLVATVTGIIEDGIIVRVGGMDGKQDALCQYLKKNPTIGYSSEFEVPPIGKNVLIKIRKKEEFDNKQNPIYRIYGDILRVF